MIRSQIVLDAPIADQLRARSEQSHASMSSIVREALVEYFVRNEPDLGWIGSLKPIAGKSHDLDDIRASVEAGRTAEVESFRLSPRRSPSRPKRAS